VARVYIYVVARDFGFAPNPFHGVCTVATCKPRIRNAARVGDWVFGVGGTKLKAVGRCVFAMKVTDAIGFDAYWSDPEYFDKRPVRNGSRKMMLGDNIYHRAQDGTWRQADSHHSQSDGSADPHNIQRDTSADRVLISRHFYYFGGAAPTIPSAHLSAIGFQNAIGHRVYPFLQCEDLVHWLETAYLRELNTVFAVPFLFRQSTARYSVRNDRIVA
jgi:hypothetical protein